MLLPIQIVLNSRWNWTHENCLPCFWPDGKTAMESHYFSVWSLQLWSLSCSEKGLKNSGPERDTNLNLCNGSAVLYQCSYEVKWVQVVMWFDAKPVDDGYVYLIHWNLVSTRGSKTWISCICIISLYKYKVIIMYIFVFLRKQKFYSPLNLNRLQFFIDSGRLNPKEPINMYHLWRSGAVGGRIMDGVKLLGTVRNSCTQQTQELLSFTFVPEMHKMGSEIVFELASPTVMKSNGSLSSIVQAAKKYELINQWLSK